MAAKDEARRTTLIFALTIDNALTNTTYRFFAQEIPTAFQV